MLDMFSTGVLVRVIRSLLPTPMNGLLQRYFGSVEEHQTEFIAFDKDDRRRRIAPFVHARSPGKRVASRGQRVETFKPAYIKDLREFDPARTLKRIAGEPLAGELSPEARLQALVAQDLADMTDMLDRRLEVMAAELLRTGKLVISGEDYPAVTVDFARNAALTVAAPTGTARWSDAGSNPLKALQTWSTLVAKLSGIGYLDVIMEVDAWSEFRDHAKVQAKLNLRRAAQPDVDVGAQLGEGLTFRGEVDGFNIYSYQGWYVDPADDTEKVILPTGTVILTAQGVEGVQAFGAIQDLKAGLMPMKLFVKSFDEENPSARFLLGQSAPLLIPGRPNASLSVDVLGGGS
jgi:hypothetical protein